MIFAARLRGMAAWTNKSRIPAYPWNGENKGQINKW